MHGIRILRCHHASSSKYYHTSLLQFMGTFINREVTFRNRHNITPETCTWALKSSWFMLFHCGILRDGFLLKFVWAKKFACTMEWSLIPADDLTSVIRAGCVVSNKSSVFSVPFWSLLVGKVTICDKWLSLMNDINDFWRFPLGSVASSLLHVRPGTLKSPPSMTWGELVQLFILLRLSPSFSRALAFSPGGR